MMSRFFRILWAVYGLLFFFLIFSFYLPTFLVIFLIGNSKTRKKFVRLSYYYIPRIVFIPIGIRLKTIGPENVSLDENYIVVSNHQSLLDIFANPGTCPVAFKYLSKIEVHHMPVLNIITDEYCVYVDRTSHESRQKSFQNMVKAVVGGDSILIYPEGTRNRTRKPLKEFYDGAFKLAITTQKPILVQTLVNSSSLSSPFLRFDLKPGRIISYWDKPIITKGLEMKDLPALKNQVHTIMARHLMDHKDCLILD